MTSTPEHQIGFESLQMNVFIFPKIEFSFFHQKGKISYFFANLSKYVVEDNFGLNFNPIAKQEFFNQHFFMIHRFDIWLNDC